MPKNPSILIQELNQLTPSIALKLNAQKLAFLAGITPAKTQTLNQTTTAELKTYLGELRKLLTKGSQAHQIVDNAEKELGVYRKPLPPLPATGAPPRPEPIGQEESSFLLGLRQNGVTNIREASCLKEQVFRHITIVTETGQTYYMLINRALSTVTLFEGTKDQTIGRKPIFEGTAVKEQVEKATAKAWQEFQKSKATIDEEELDAAPQTPKRSSSLREAPEKPYLPPSFTLEDQPPASELTQQFAEKCGAALKYSKTAIVKAVELQESKSNPLLHKYEVTLANQPAKLQIEVMCKSKGGTMYTTKVNGKAQGTHMTFSPEDAACHTLNSLLEKGISSSIQTGHSQGTTANGKHQGANPYK